MAGLTKQYLQFAVNDVKPVVFNVTSSTGSTPVSAKYSVYDHNNGVAVGPQNQTAAVNGGVVSTPNLMWATISIFIVSLSVTFSDGIVDNTVIAQVTVNAIPT